MTVQRTLQKQGAIFSSTSDTETILHLVAMSKERDLNARFIDAVRQVEGAFSLVALSDTPVTILDPKCTAKTFPDYFEQLARISTLA